MTLRTRIFISARFVIVHVTYHRTLRFHFPIAYAPAIWTLSIKVTIEPLNTPLNMRQGFGVAVHHIDPALVSSVSGEAHWWKLKKEEMIARGGLQ